MANSSHESQVKTTLMPAKLANSDFAASERNFLILVRRLLDVSFLEQALNYQ